MTVDDLRDRLTRGDMDLATLTIESLSRSIKKPGDTDTLPFTAAALLGDLRGFGIDLTNLPPNFQDFVRLVDVAWYEREDDQLAEAHRMLAETEAWDDSHAEAEAAKYYRRGTENHAEGVSRYGPGLERARKLRERIVAMDLTRRSGSASTDTRARLMAIQVELLAHVDLVIYQLESWIGKPREHMSGAEYRRHLIAGYTRTIEKARERGTRDGKVKAAFELLQALALVLYPS